MEAKLRQADPSTREVFFKNGQPANRADIPELDTFNASSPCKSLKHRYGNYLRVFVKFESGPAAVLASERLGEMITMMDNAAESSSSAPKKNSIGVTQVHKEVPTVLSTLVILSLF
jgi:hypothetical protein